jgi:hypothetical protein
MGAYYFLGERQFHAFILQQTAGESQPSICKRNLRLCGANNYPPLEKNQVIIFMNLLALKSQTSLRRGIRPHCSGASTRLVL